LASPFGLKVGTAETNGDAFCIREGAQRDGSLKRRFEVLELDERSCEILLKHVQEWVDWLI
jgi:hypothetical protein